MKAIEVIRRGYPQTKVLDKVVYDDGRVEYCGRGWLVHCWEEETGQTFPYGEIRHPTEPARLYSFWNKEEVQQFFDENVITHYGVTSKFVLRIIALNDGGTSPSEIADILEVEFNA